MSFIHAERVARADSGETPSTARTKTASTFHREEALQKSCHALGGKLHHFFYCFGEYDALGIAELPDNKAAAALSLSADASGAVKQVSTTVLLTVAEAMDAMKKAQTDQYKPPT